MKKNKITTFLFIFCLLSAFFNIKAQGDYAIADDENILTKKERESLEKMIDFQLETYNKIFPDIISKKSDVKINVFKNYSAYLAYQEKIGGTVRHRSFGFYSDKTKEVVVCKHKHEEGFLKTCYHELSHFFIRSKMTSPPIWLNEGLATYFGYMKVSPKKITPEKYEYHIARVKTMIELNDIDLKDYVTWSHKKFTDASFTRESYGYAISYCIIYFLFQKDQETAYQIIREIGEKTGTKEAFDLHYPGEFDQFEKEFIEYYSKDK